MIAHSDESGGVSAANGNNSSSMTTPPYQDCMYDLRCQSDPLRVTKNNRVYGVACCPVTENRVVLMLSDSRLLFWELNTVDYQVQCNYSSQLKPCTQNNCQLQYNSIRMHEVQVFDAAVFCYDRILW